jgi:hypothetical protein
LAAEVIGKSWAEWPSSFVEYQVFFGAQNFLRENRLTILGLSTGKNPLRRKGRRN